MTDQHGAAELFHLAERRDWLAAAAAGEYRVSTRGVTLDDQGYIHCSLRHQLRGVAELVYADSDTDDLVVLVVDPGRVPDPIRYEAPVPGADAYPHIYRPLPAAAVTAVLPVGQDPSGRLTLPD